jgi:hypothetical protein
LVQADFASFPRQAWQEKLATPATSATLRVLTQALGSLPEFVEMSKTHKLWALGIAVVLGNCFVGAFISTGHNPLKVLSYSAANPSFLAGFLAGGLGGYFVFAALTSIFTLGRRSYRQKPNAWTNFFVMSTAFHLLALLLGHTASPAKDNVTPAVVKPVVAAASVPLTEPGSQTVPVRPALTENDLRTMAEAKNKTLPTRTSANLELTRIDPGPGMQLTYQVRVLAEGITKDSFSPADIATIRDAAIKDGCTGFRAGLESGVTYVMAYNASDGTNLFSFPIVIADC